jgi:hypothetical protein
VLISFAWTSAALLAGAKTVTRRDEWTAAHAEHFRPEQLVDAWDRLPRVKGAKKIAVIRVRRAPYRERSDAIAPDQWHAEGFAWMQAYGSSDDVVRASRIWLGWKQHPVELYVLEFELVSTICPGCSAVVLGPLGHTAGMAGPLFRCCAQCALNRYGCRCALGEPSVAKHAYDLSDQELAALEEALDR